MYVSCLATGCPSAGPACFLLGDKLPACWPRLLPGRPPRLLLPWRQVARLLAPPAARSPAPPAGMPLRLLRYRITGLESSVRRRSGPREAICSSAMAMIDGKLPSGEGSCDRRSGPKRLGKGRCTATLSAPSLKHTGLPCCSSPPSGEVSVHTRHWLVRSRGHPLSAPNL